MFFPLRKKYFPILTSRKRKTDDAIYFIGGPRPLRNGYVMGNDESKEVNARLY
jgi:hypothetical protein